MEELQFMGYETETTTTKHIHASTFAHNRISDVITSILDRPMLFDAGVKRIKIIERYKEVKKSTRPSEKSSPKEGQGSRTGSQTPLNGSIVTEQGIRINFGTSGIMSVPIGPM
jgi:hypothetical protein